MDGVESRLDQIADELLVLNGIVLRLEGREIETTGLKAMLDRDERWLGDLGRRVTELEGVRRIEPAVTTPRTLPVIVPPHRSR